MMNGHMILATSIQFTIFLGVQLFPWAQVWVACRTDAKALGKDYIDECQDHVRLWFAAFGVDIAGPVF